MISNSSSPIIHIGLPKTGTTFLQEHYFPHLACVNFLGKAKTLSLEMILRDREYLHKVPFVSHEHLLACPFETNKGGWFEVFSRNLVNLKILLPEARLMVSLRSHVPLVKSYYLEHISKPGREVYPVFEKFFTFGDSSGALVTAKDITFRLIIEECTNVFGCEPFVFFNEEIAQSPEGLDLDLKLLLGRGGRRLDECNGFLTNPSPRYRQAKILRRANIVNKKLESVSKHLSLYGLLFRRAGLTPDRVCRIHLRSLWKQPFGINENVERAIHNHFEQDMKYAVEYILETRKRDLRQLTFL